MAPVPVSTVTACPCHCCYLVLWPVVVALVLLASRGPGAVGRRPDAHRCRRGSCAARCCAARGRGRGVRDRRRGTDDV